MVKRRIGHTISDERAQSPSAKVQISSKENFRSTYEIIQTWNIKQIVRNIITAHDEKSAIF
jgi:hypothetical protein